MAEEKFQNLPKEVLFLNKAIKFCALAHKTGYIVLSSSRIDPGTFLTESETEKYAFQTGISYGMQKSWQDKLGKIEYSVSHYDNMMVAMVPLLEDHFLLVSMDSEKQRDVYQIVNGKIIPFLKYAISQ